MRERVLTILVHYGVTGIVRASFAASGEIDGNTKMTPLF